MAHLDFTCDFIVLLKWGQNRWLRVRLWTGWFVYPRELLSAWQWHSFLGSTNPHVQGLRLNHISTTSKYSDWLLSSHSTIEDSEKIKLIKLGMFSPCVQVSKTVAIAWKKITWKEIVSQSTEQQSFDKKSPQQSTPPLYPGKFGVHSIQ